MHSSRDIGVAANNPAYAVSKPWKQPIEKARHGLYGGTHKTTVGDSTPTFHRISSLSDFCFDRVSWDEGRRNDTPDCYAPIALCATAQSASSFMLTIHDER